jgi:alpha-L-rhamnosidase
MYITKTPAGILVSLTAALLLFCAPTASAATLTHLRCEYLTNPLGIDVARPRLSWVIESNRRGERQTAFQVLVASSEELLKKDKGNLWDSRKVESGQSIQLEYAGKPLESRELCYWKVQT